MPRPRSLGCQCPTRRWGCSVYPPPGGWRRWRWTLLCRWGIVGTFSNPRWGGSRRFCNPRVGAVHSNSQDLLHHHSRPRRIQAPRCKTMNRVGNTSILMRNLHRCHNLLGTSCMGRTRCNPKRPDFAKEPDSNSHQLLHHHSRPRRILALRCLTMNVGSTSILMHILHRCHNLLGTSCMGRTRCNPKRPDFATEPAWSELGLDPASLVLSLVGAASLPSLSASARDGMLSRFCPP